MTQAEIMEAVGSDTHALWNAGFVDKVNVAFGTNIQAQEYEAGGGFKGLTLHDGSSRAKGIASFDLMPMLCQALNVEYEGKLGRGFQVRACIEALKAAGYPKDGQ